MTFLEYVFFVVFGVSCILVLRLFVSLFYNKEDEDKGLLSVSDYIALKCEISQLPDSMGVVRRMYRNPQDGHTYFFIGGDLVGCPTNRDGTPDVHCWTYVSEFDPPMSHGELFHICCQFMDDFGAYHYSESLANKTGATK